MTGHPYVTIDGNDRSRVLSIVGGSGHELHGLTITGGRATGPYGAYGGGVEIDGAEVHIRDSTISGNTAAGYRLYYADAAGGGLHIGNRSTVTIGNSTISDNHAFASDTNNGGGIAVIGSSLTILDCTISGNTVGGVLREEGFGGGISALRAQLTIVGSTLSGNVADEGEGRSPRGGAVGSSGSIVSIRESTISGNAAVSRYGGYGGGIVAGGGSLGIYNSTVAGNFAGDPLYGYSALGGGIDLSGGIVATIIHSTIVGNTVSGDGSDAEPTGGGVSVRDTAQLRLANSIVADNAVLVNAPGTGGGSSDIAGTIASNGANLFSQAGIDGALASDIVVDPQDVLTTVLTPLRDNGGPTSTYAPRVGSVVIDAGNADDARDAFGPLRNDQTGAPRGERGPVAIGAVEGAVDLPPMAADDTILTDFFRPVVIDVLANDADPEDGTPMILRIAQEPVSGKAIVTREDELLYVPASGAGSAEVTFTYRVVDAAGSIDVARVVVTMTEPSALPSAGGPAANRLAGTPEADILLGEGGDDVLLGFTGADLLDGGAGRDVLRGGGGDDVLLGGAALNTIFGGGGADLFVTAGPGLQVIEDFDLAEGDRVLVTAPVLQDGTGRLVGDRLKAIEMGTTLVLRADLDGDGGFDATLAKLVGAAGLGLDDVLMNAIA